MSIAGRNRHRGSTAHVYRAIKAERDGGLTGRTWVRVVTDLRVALHAAADEIARRIWGQEAAIDAVIMVPAAVDIRADDALIVLAGEYAGQRFYVQGARSLRRYRECALVSTPEVIDATLVGPDPDREPLEVA